MNEKKIKLTMGVFVRLPITMVNRLDLALSSNINFSNRSQFIRVAIAEKIKRDGIDLFANDIDSRKNTIDDDNIQIPA